jgi:predicted amidophosphoribosyltransferase
MEATNIRKCSKCGQPLDSSEYGICLFCNKTIPSSGRQDIDDWKKREERDEW